MYFLVITFGFLLAAALLIPALTVATSLLNWLITLIIPPRILPKLDFKDGIPGACQTLVVIPAIYALVKEPAIRRGQG